MKEMVVCPRCGQRFIPGQCGLPCARECHTICCPRCGYHQVEESSLVRLGRRLFSKRGKDVEKRHR